MKVDDIQIKLIPAFKGINSPDVPKFVASELKQKVVKGFVYLGNHRLFPRLIAYSITGRTGSEFVKSLKLDEGELLELGLVSREKNEEVLLMYLWKRAFQVYEVSRSQKSY